jgi:hypothetical protein
MAPGEDIIEGPLESLLTRNCLSQASDRNKGSGDSHLQTEIYKYLASRYIGLLN